MLLTKKRGSIRLGPKDNGRRMRLDDFSAAVAADGYVFELAGGVVEVSQIPKPQHARMVADLRQQLAVWSEVNPAVIELMSGGMDSKLLIGPSQSERHPDVTVYLSPQPEVDEVWSFWIPEIVIEVVSESSAKRDYDQKPAEYLELGVKENWIVDQRKHQMLALIRWRGQWRKKTIKAGQKYSTELLPGFKLDLKRVFSSGK